MCAAIALAASLTACAKAPTAAAGASGPPASPVAAGLDNPASANDGARVYITNCSSCHQIDGRGVSGAFPPLAGNRVVTGDPRRVIAIVKFGISGKIGNGQAYAGPMPPWGGLISDGDIAAVVTYIRTAWNNGGSAVSPAGVARVTH